MATTSVISPRQASTMLATLVPTGNTDYDDWHRGWLWRIANGYTPCTCAQHHRGCCSSQPRPTSVQLSLFGAP